MDMVRFSSSFPGADHTRQSTRRNPAQSLIAVIFLSALSAAAKAAD